MVLSSSSSSSSLGVPSRRRRRRPFVTIVGAIVCCVIIGVVLSADGIDCIDIKPQLSGGDASTTSGLSDPTTQQAVVGAGGGSVYVAGTGRDGGGVTSLEIVSPSSDGLQILTDTLTVVVRVNFRAGFSSYSDHSVCLAFNGQAPKSPCATFAPGAGPPSASVATNSLITSFVLGDIPAGFYSLTAHAAPATKSPSREFEVITEASCSSSHQHQANVTIVDGFTFFNEFDMLLLRLETLNDFVDKFLIVEAPRTFTGENKPLYWSEVGVKDPRFRPYLHKITLAVVESFPESEATAAWDREYYQRDYISTVASRSFPPDAFLIVSDVDEIPSPRALMMIRNCKHVHTPLTLQSSYFYYNFNWKKRGSWDGIQVMKVCQFGREMTASSLRRILGYAGGSKLKEEFPPSLADFDYGTGSPCSVAVISLLKNSGWHLSYFLPKSEIINKIKSFSHTEFSSDATLDAIREKFDTFVSTGSDLFGRRDEAEEMEFVAAGSASLPPTALSYPMFFRRVTSQVDVTRAESYKQQFEPVPLSDLEPFYIHGNAVGGVSKACRYQVGDADYNRAAYDDDGHPAFAIGIVSALGNFDRRQTIRSTWLNHPELLKTKSGHRKHEYAFFVGLDSATGSIPASIVEEMNTYHDIVVVNKVDTYKNMIYKVVALFDWGARTCMATYVCRCNDDVYLRFGKVFLSLFHEYVPTNIYAGYFMDEVKVLRPEEEWNGHNEKSSQVSRSTYPADVYPVFAQGNAYILSSDLASLVVDLKNQPWRKLFADDLLVGLIMDQSLAKRVLIHSDFVTDGADFVCTEDAFFHFDISSNQMRALYQNDLRREAGEKDVLQCDGVSV